MNEPKQSILENRFLVRKTSKPSQRKISSKMKKYYPLLFLCFFFHSLSAQYHIGIIPRQSPDKKVYQKIGFTEIEINYGSPSVKGRPIWGELVSYSKAWRAGANSATTIEFGSPVKIGGNNLDSGKYGFFIIPVDDENWTVIFNKIHKQWGSFNYDENEDVLRVMLKPKRVKFNSEKLNYTIEQSNFKEGKIVLSWEFKQLEIPIQTNYLRDFALKIEAKANTQPESIKWVAFIQGAEHLEEIKDSLELAQSWISKAEKLMNTTADWNDQYYPLTYIQGHLYWTKAKIYAWDKNYKEAIKAVEQLKSLKQNDFYQKKNEKEGIDLHFSNWKRK